MPHLDGSRTRHRNAGSAVVAAAVSPLLVLLTLLGAPLPAAGQDGFLFRPPVAGLTLRAGPMLYSARSDVFDALRQDLTLNRGDFRATAFGADFVVAAMPQLDVVLGMGYARASPRSEFRDWVDQDSLPIEQVTRLQSVPLTASLRYLLVPRGRSISSVAWLPRSTTPYLGAGGGAVWYRLRQTGDFVDFNDLSIFTDVIESSGWHGVMHGLVGVDHWLSPRLGLNAEARYTRGRAPAEHGFRSFDRLDIGGFQATVGLSVRW
jgi:hypothetical protein